MPSMSHSHERKQGAAANQEGTTPLSTSSSLPPDNSSFALLTNPRKAGDGTRLRDIGGSMDGPSVAISSSSPIQVPLPSSQQADYMQNSYATFFPPIPTSRSAFPLIPLPASQIALHHLPQSNFSYQSVPAAPQTGMEMLSAEYYGDRSIFPHPSRDPSRGSREIPFGLVQQQRLPRGTVSVAPKSVEPDRQRKRSAEREQATGEKKRKKQKLASDDEAEAEDEAFKKSRGRPRLDTKDKTAADRRRTQIRMAQRAYRHRKETTISSLEKQVRELRTANEQMSSIFIGLHDYAAGRGILHREPEFGSQLRTATEEFLALAKSVQAEENSKDEEGASLDGSKTVPLEEVDPEPETQAPLSESDSRPSVTSQPEDPQPIQNLWGYQVVREDGHPESPAQMDWNQQGYLPPARPDHQVLSRATLDNASFSFDFSENLDLQNFRAQVPDVADNYQALAIFQDALPLNKTLSQHETTFGRHLQRAALERGWRLISADSPNPKRLNDVFGFCLRFETRDEIKARLKRGLERTSRDSLFDWKAPFVHLGGAGTHYPEHAEISGKMVPKFRTGMSMGPFAPAVARTRETAMFDDFRINLPGFEGEFFDANDVEGYLSGRGIAIPPGSDFVTIDLDLLLFNDVSSPESLSDSNTRHSPETPKSPPAGIVELNRQEDNPFMQDDEFLDMMQPSDDVSFQQPFGDWSHLEQAKMPPPGSSNLTGLFFNSVNTPQFPVNEDIIYQDEHVVTLSVRVLIEELIANTVCLGRAPGFRPSDVEAALRRALRKAF